MTYSISRKYKMPQNFEMLDLGVEGVETQEEVKKLLDDFDLIAKEYRAKHEPMQDLNASKIPSKESTLKIGEKIDKTTSVPF